MRIAVLSDTHGFLDPRLAARISECDMAVHAGDIGGADVLLAMQPRERVVAVRGNNDTPEKWSQAEQHMLANLPSEATVDLPGGRLVVVHGDDGGSIAERHRRYRRRFANARAVVYGHSHELTLDCEATPWILNPGAAGRTRTKGGPSCLFLECLEDLWHVEPLRLESRRYPSIRRGARRAEPTVEGGSG
ncbi:MAG: metallophosphoesterase family protein [Ectothiorhodospiraceae bacterium]|jgi:putative phosphoesterase